MIRYNLKLMLEAPPSRPEEPVEIGWQDVAPVDRLGLEVGYRLVPLVDRAQDGELLRRVRGIRKKIAQDLGYLVPAVHIRDNLQLKPNGYRVTLKGVSVAEGEAVVGKYLAINPGRVLGTIPGQATTDPAYGLPAVWIDAGQRDLAQTYGYTVVDTGTVVATHLTKIINEHAPELLGREETQQLLDHIAKQSPKLVEDLVPKILAIGTLQKVLQNLRIILGSLAGYWAGEFSNSVVLATMKVATHGRWLWTRTVGSTLVAQALDSSIFLVVAFGGTLSLPTLTAVLISNYVFKCSVEILFTPATYAVVRFLKRSEEINHFDVGTRFNPFTF